MEELELYRAVVVMLNVVQLAILAALLRWVRGNGHTRDDRIDAVERYLDSQRKQRGERGSP